MSQNASLPCTIGLCSDPICAQECYMPDPEPGDKCPYCPNELIIFARPVKTITHGRHCGNVSLPLDGVQSPPDDLGGTARKGFA